MRFLDGIDWMKSIVLDGTIDCIVASTGWNQSDEMEPFGLIGLLDQMTSIELESIGFSMESIRQDGINWIGIRYH